MSKRFDMPDGSFVNFKIDENDRWELINSKVFEEGAKEVSSFIFDRDLEGKPFSLKNLKFLYYFPKYTGESSLPSYFFTQVNGVSGGPNSPMIYTSGFTPPSTSHGRGGVLEIDILKEGELIHEKSVRNNTGGSVNMFGSGTQFLEYYGNRCPYEEINSIGFAGGIAYEGCSFYLWGVRNKEG